LIEKVIRQKARQCRAFFFVVVRRGKLQLMKFLQTRGFTCDIFAAPETGVRDL